MTDLSPNQYSGALMKMRIFDIAEFFGYQWVLCDTNCFGDGRLVHWCLWKPDRIKWAAKQGFLKRPKDVSPALMEDCHVPDYFRTSSARDSLLYQIAQQSYKLRTKFVHHLHDTTNLSAACKNRQDKEQMRTFVSFHLLKATPAEVAEAWWRTIMNVPRTKEIENAIRKGSIDGLSDESGGQGEVVSCS